jgi:hypothetical protein
MGVVNDGHRDANGGGSYADAVFEGGWSRTGSPRRASVGPLAQWDGSDPIKKTARVLGDDNNFESTSGPGANRVVQSPDSASEKNRAIDQSPADAKGQPSPDAKKPTGGPGTGTKSPATTASSSSGAKPETRNAGEPVKAESYLRQKESPPYPRDLFPAPVSPVWTGSGPQAALASDYQKVAEPLPIDEPVDESSVDEALFYAGVPMHLRPGRLLRGAAELALSKVASSDAEYLVRGDVHPLKLVAMLDDFFGGEWRDWEPETIRASLAKEAGADPSDGVMNKVMAVKIAMARPEVFFDRWQAFEKMAVSLNDRDPAMTVTEDLDPEEIANAVTIVRKISGDGDFSPEVEAYVAARLHNSGFVVAPPQLSFADARLGELVRDDGFRGKVIVAYAQAVKSDGDVAESEDPVDIQVARLLRSHVYVLDRLSQGREQLGT